MFRFNPGVTEAATWSQDGQNWTKCNFNRKPNLAVAAQAIGGVEDADKPGFVFDIGDKALEAAKLLGQEIALSAKMMGREARLKSHKDGRLVVQIQKRDGDGEIRGWLAKKDHLTRVFDAPTEPEKKQPEADFDGLVRTLVMSAIVNGQLALPLASKTLAGRLEPHTEVTALVK